MSEKKRGRASEREREIPKTKIHIRHCKINFTHSHTRTHVKQLVLWLFENELTDHYALITQTYSNPMQYGIGFNEFEACACVPTLLCVL